MVSVALWSAPHGGMPHRLAASPPNTEAELENWVKLDPSLVRDGLIVVAQQLVFANLVRLDLLCIENRSRWLVVELKRGRLAREVAAQALDYVSLLSNMTKEELRSRVSPYLQQASQDTRELVDGLLEAEDEDNPREVAAVVVGGSADEPLLRITRYLTEQYQVPISVVELQAFTSPSGDMIIVREETGTEVDLAPTEGPKAATTVDERWTRVRNNAAAAGFGEALQQVQQILRDCPVYLRPYTSSVMFAPPSNKSRYIGVVGFSAQSTASLGYGRDEIAEFYPTLDPVAIEAALGVTPVKVTPDELVAFANRLAALFATIPAPQSGE